MGTHPGSLPGPSAETGLAITAVKGVPTMEATMPTWSSFSYRQVPVRIG